MNPATIHLKYHPQPVRDTAAWFLPGQKPLEWVQEIIQWNVPQMSLRLFLIPESDRNRTPRGLLVVSDHPPKHAQGLPYGRIASRLYLPVEASLQPEVSQQELDQLLRPPYTWIWHPATGLIACEKQDEYNIADFFKGDLTQQTDWDHAFPGIAFSNQLRSISLIQFPDLSTLFEQEEREIGSDQDSLDQLPKDPKESVFDNLPNPLKIPKALFAKGILSLTNHVPTRNHGVPNWINHLENWAGKQLFSAFRPDQSKRNREIRRLLNLLGNNPDEGLKYALPMGGEAGHRGVAPPGNTLSQRDLNVDFSNMGSGGAADYWDVPYETQLELMNRYRELATREVQLGRYRRAAYIYAHLLGDFSAAAQTLKSGRQWREAAVIYKDKLNQPRSAAECLVEGGLWAEAIAEYEELKEYETVGDLHRKLDQEDEAVEAYRRAATQFHHQKLHTSAARILEEKVHATDEAIVELESGWPHSSQARLCLNNLFEIYSRHGLHQLAQQKINHLAETDLHLGNRLPLIQFLTQTRASYPDRTVAEHAEENSRILISRSLDHADPAQRKTLVTELGKLVPSDKLLQRDTSRYLQLKKTARKPVKRNTRSGSVQLTRTIELSADVDWQTALTIGETIYAAGINAQTSRLVLERCQWDGSHIPSRLSWTLNPGEIHDFPILMIPKSTSPEHQLYVRVLTARDQFQSQVLPESDHFPSQLTASDFNGLPHIILGATAGSLDGISWNLAIQRDLLLTSTYNRQNHLISSHSIPVPQDLDLEDGAIQFPIPCLERRNKLFFALGSYLGIIDSKDAYFENYQRQIRSMVASFPNTQIRVALAFEQGGTVLWDGFGSETICSFGEGIDAPCTAFQRNGNLIVAGSNGLEIYQTQQRKLELIRNLTFSTAAEPIAVLSGNQNQEFGLLDRTGQFSIYQTGY